MTAEKNYGATDASVFACESPPPELTPEQARSVAAIRARDSHLSDVVALCDLVDRAYARRRAREHELKTWMPFYEDVLSGRKSFEVRKNDRGFRVGDVLRLREWDRDHELAHSPSDFHYTGRSLRRTVAYVLTGENWGIKDGFAVLGLGEVLTGDVR